MLETKSLRDDHYLSLTIANGKLKADFTCLNHDTCVPAKLIRQEEEQNGRYNVYNVALEWYMGKGKVVLRNGNIRLERNFRFIEWSYLDDVQTYDELVKELREGGHHDTAFVVSVEQLQGPKFEFVCLEEHGHETNGSLCDGYALAENINDDPFTNFGEEDGTELRNDYVNVAFVDPDYFGDDSSIIWSYAIDK
jgi:hypothetical protein